MARRRRLRTTASGLDVTAFINLIVVLVPFLLSTAVFSRLAVLDLALPARSAGDLEQLKTDDLQHEVIIRADRIDVADRIGGLIRSIPAVQGRHDLSQVAALMRELKARFPAKTTATLLAEPQTPYEQVVQLMDAVRGRLDAQGAQLVRTELFPDITIGDAPPDTRT